MMTRGFTIISDSPYLVVFDRVSDNFAAMMLFGTRMGGAPHYRLSFSFGNTGSATRVMADIALIGNAGTDFERRTDFNQGNDLAEVQNLLNTIAASMPAPATAIVSAPQP